MAIQECGKCSAPLELGTPGTVVRCPYCGTDNRMRPLSGGPAAPAARVRAEAPRETSARPPTLVVLMLVVGAFLAVTALSAALFLGGALDGAGPVPAADEPARHPVSALATTEETYLVLEPPPGMEGSLEAFPVDANDGWVRDIARAWRPDARLRYMQAEEVHVADGTANDVSYQFISPAALADYAARAATEDPEVNYSLGIRVAEGELTAIRTVGRPEEPEPPPETSFCPVDKAMSVVMEAGALEKRPAYRIGAGHSTTGEPYVQVNLLGSSDSATVGAGCKRW